MNQQVRELLLTARATEHWNEQFNEKVEELMALVSKIDTDQQIRNAGEVMDVYRKTKERPKLPINKSSSECCEKPFKFIVFSN
jgi:hypothetical protein